MYAVINDYKWRIPSPINLFFVIPRIVYYSSKKSYLKIKIKIRRASLNRSCNIEGLYLDFFSNYIFLVFSVLGTCKSIKVSEEEKDNKIREYRDDFQKTAALRINYSGLGEKWIEWCNIFRQLLIFVYTKQWRHILFFCF